MELPIFAVFLVLWTSTTIAYPISSHVLPKEYYQRQNLPEIPGYIPVYIKHDDEPLPKWKENPNTKSSEQQEEKREEPSIGDVKQTTEIESSTMKEQPQPDHKGKNKKVTENFQALKLKENKD